MPKVVEHHQHDVCPRCGTPSVPFDGVPDQALRGCEKCDHEWVENLDEPPITAACEEDDD